jgi:hypothetical protein
MPPVEGDREFWVLILELKCLRWHCELSIYFSLLHSKVLAVDGVTTWKRPESLTHHMEASWTLAGSSLFRLVCHYIINVCAKSQILDFVTEISNSTQSAASLGTSQGCQTPFPRYHGVS